MVLGNIYCMKIVNLDKKKNVVKVVVTNLDDLWHLSNIIQKGDKLSGGSTRKIKLGGEEEKSRSVKKTIYLTINVEKSEYSTELLKVLGTVVSGPETISLGSMHGIEIKQGDELKIEKTIWPKFMIDRLKEAESKIPEILILVLDDEQANFATMSASGIKHLAKISLELSKKRYEKDKKAEKEKFTDLLKKLEQLNKDLNPKTILVASPIFWKDVAAESIKSKLPELKSKLKLETVSSGSKRSVSELLSSGALNKIMTSGRAQKEAVFVDEFLKLVSKNSKKVTYGFDQVRAASDSAAVETLLVTDELIKNLREDDDYKKIEDLMLSVEQNNGIVHIISNANEPGKKLQGMSGIAAILRYAV